MIDLKKAAQLLTDADNILIISHRRPDGDTLGSAFALKEALIYLGKNACVACSTKISKKYLMLTEGKEELLPEFDPDFIVSVDVASKMMFGDELSPYSDKVDLCIDHHPTNKQYAVHNIILADSASTGEIIFNLLKEMNIPMNKIIANALYTAVITDTGCFRYSNTNSNTFRIAAELYDIGAQAFELTRHMLETSTKEAIAIMRLVLDNLNFYADGKIAVIVITSEMINSTAASEDDVEALTILPRNIEGVEVGLAIRQLEGNEFKVSARSNGKADVSYLCSQFGGGGHVKAAGCSINGSAKDAEMMMVAKTLDYFKECGI